jgi:hypothetical protein
LERFQEGWRIWRNSNGEPETIIMVQGREKKFSDLDN